MPAAVFGCAAHAESGAFPLVLQGEARLQAHASIWRLLDKEKRPATWQQDLLPILEHDPALFMEEVPTLPKSDPLWHPFEGARAWYKTWARCAAVEAADDVIKALIVKGVSPNDRSVFHVRPLQMSRWQRDPDKVQFLLARGADPDSSYSTLTGEADPGTSVVRDVLQWARTCIQPGAVDYEALWRTVSVVRLLIAAGAKNFDASGSVARSRETAIGMLVDQLELVPAHRPEAEALTDLVRRLVAAGASVNEPSGRHQYRPIVTAIMGQHLRTTALLIELGAEVADDVIVRAESVRLPEVRSLVEEAQRAGGAEFEAQVRALVTGAQMQSVIDKADVPTVETAEAAPRARRAL